jgi:hypothetical protein
MDLVSNIARHVPPPHADSPIVQFSVTRIFQVHQANWEIYSHFLDSGILSMERSWQIL